MGKLAIALCSNCFRFNQALGAGIIFFFPSQFWKVSHSWGRLLSAVCFSPSQRDLGPLPTKPRRNGQFEELSSPQASKPLGCKSWLPQTVPGPSTFTRGGRGDGGRERGFQPTGPRPGPGTPVVKAELGLHCEAPRQPIHHAALGGSRQSLSNAVCSARLGSVRLGPKSHPRPRGSVPRPSYLPAPPHPSSFL